MTPRFLHDNTCLLDNERGVTLLEVLVTVAVLSVLVITVYIGIQFAEKQSVQNFRLRKATLIASGELDRQYFINKYNANKNDLIFMPFSNKEVLIDALTERESLIGLHSLTASKGVEISETHHYPYTQLISRVEWIDPATDKTQFVEMREDFYIRVGN